MGTGILVLYHLSWSSFCKCCQRTNPFRNDMVSVEQNCKNIANQTRFSFVFPNTALTTATFAVDLALGGNRAIQIVGCVLAVGVITTWFFVFFMMLRAIHLKQILWPQKQEDRNEGGWLEGDERMKSADRRRETIFRRASAVRNHWRENEHRIKHRRPKGAERELSHDRADWIIKEMSGRPARGRSGHE